jgi:hypothetical protein
LLGSWQPSSIRCFCPGQCGWCRPCRATRSASSRASRCSPRSSVERGREDGGFSGSLRSRSAVPHGRCPLRA